MRISTSIKIPVSIPGAALLLSAPFSGAAGINTKACPASACKQKCLRYDAACMKKRGEPKNKKK